MTHMLADYQLDALVALLGKDAVRTDANSRNTYGSDWMPVTEPDPVAIVFPHNAEHVQALLRQANEWHCPLVPSGGRTGLAGGAAALHGEIVVSFEKMNRIIEVDAAERLILCEPGVITAQVQQAAREHGLYYPIEFAADGSSQIGGNIATNAGGVRVLRYGMTRAQVAGLSVITGHGATIDEMRCLRKDNAGYALRELFVGSEGTLGMIVLAGLRLQSTPPALATALLLLDDVAALPSVMQAMQAFELHACELMDARAWQWGNAEQSAPLDVPPAALYLLMEASAESMSADALACALQHQPVSEVLLAQSAAQAERFWTVRESITAALIPLQPFKCDIGFRLSCMPAVLASIGEHWPDAVVFGHLGDGNLHLNIVNNDDRAITQAKVWQLVKRYNGTITAEHGVGLLRRDTLQSMEAKARLQAMQNLKRVFDPNGVLNPGKLC